MDTPARRTPLADLDIEEPAWRTERRRADEEFDYVDEEIDTNPGTGTFETIVLEGDTFLQTEETDPARKCWRARSPTCRAASPRRHDTAEFAALMEEHFDDDRANSERIRAGRGGPAPELAALREATGEFRHEANIHGTGRPTIRPHWFREPSDPAGDWRLIGRRRGARAVAGRCRSSTIGAMIWPRAPAGSVPCASLSSMLGEPLHPNWNLNAYDVRQLGAAADAADDPDACKVRLSLTNVGERAQALPLIRLTLRDRYGKAVSRGELAARAVPARAMSAASVMIRRDQRIDTEVRVLDPSRQASSFELDVCVTAAGGGLRCAGDTPALAARHLVSLAIGPHALAGRVLLAPMAGVTDPPFRELCAEQGAALACGEMLSADQSLWHTPKSRRRMAERRRARAQRDRGGAARRGRSHSSWPRRRNTRSDDGADIIDLNLGCPAKKVCDRLCGSALLGDEALVARIFDALVRAVDGAGDRENPHRPRSVAPQCHAHRATRRARRHRRHRRARAHARRPLPGPRRVRNNPRGEGRRCAFR